MSLVDAEARLLRTARALHADQFAEPSLLPDWSRAHVLAHVALNAEGLTRMIDGLRSGEPATMYDSDEARDTEIAALAAASPDAIRARLVSSAERIGSALAWLAQAGLPGDTSVERVPGGMQFRVTSLPERRLVEVEIHHADLAAGYAAADWPDSFTAGLIDRRTHRHNWDTDFVAHATDLDRDWRFGSPGPDAAVVSGPAPALGWWLTGRGSGNDLSSTTGALPRIEGF